MKKKEEERSGLKNIDLKRKRTKFEKKNKTKPNHKWWDWKTISVKKKIRTTTNNNQKNDDYIWY